MTNRKGRKRRQRRKKERARRRMEANYEAAMDDLFRRVSGELERTQWAIDNLRPEDFTGLAPRYSKEPQR